MNKTLHDIIGLTRENSTLKSVFVTERYFEDCLVVEVEAWDETGYRALNTSVSAFDKFYDYLNRTLLENFDKLNDRTDSIRVIIYGTYGAEYILVEDGRVF